MGSNIGIDAGGTLIKVAYRENGAIQYRKFTSKNPDEVVEWIENHFSNPKICITGGKATLLQNRLAPIECNTMVEFEATCNGVSFLLKNDEVMLNSFILTNVGTGTSIHFINNDSHIRVGGTGVGGGTLMGLSSLLTGVHDFSHIVETAKTGHRDTIDLKVKDIYEGSAPPLLGDLTASNFGKVLSNSSHEINDLLASIIGLVGETFVTASIFAADRFGTKNIVYIGSSFIDNDILRRIVDEYTRFKGMNPVYVENGEYSGAIGALLSLS